MPLKIELVYKEDSRQRVSLHLNVLIKEADDLGRAYVVLSCNGRKDRVKGLQVLKDMQLPSPGNFSRLISKRNMIVERRIHRRLKCNM